MGVTSPLHASPRPDDVTFSSQCVWVRGGGRVASRGLCSSLCFVTRLLVIQQGSGQMFAALYCALVSAGQPACPSAIKCLMMVDVDDCLLLVLIKYLEGSEWWI